MPKSQFQVTVAHAHDRDLAGSPLRYLATDHPEIVCHIVEIAPGGEVGRHKHPAPTFMYVLEGSLAVELDDGTVRQYHAGDSLVEPQDTWVNNRNDGEGTCRFLAVLPSAQGRDPVVMAEEPETV